MRGAAEGGPRLVRPARDILRLRTRRRPQIGPEAEKLRARRALLHPWRLGTPVGLERDLQRLPLEQDGCAATEKE